jgi:hypothetical protein
MNRLALYLSPKTMADLRTLMAPTGDYIAAIGTFAEQKAAVVAALAILIENVQEINGTGSAYLETFSQNYLG